MANFLTKLLDVGAGDLVTAVGDAVVKVKNSDDERIALENELARAQLQYEQEVAVLGEKNTEAYLGDIANARENQSRVQEAESASWLAKNIQPILAFVIVGLTFFLYWKIIFNGAEIFKEGSGLHDMKDIIIYILGALTTVSTQVASFFFGSSQGSADKHKAIMELSRKQ